MDIANRVLALWQDGYYTPGPAYPYILEETLQELQEGPKAKGNYEESFQPFTPVNNERPRGIGAVAGGIVQHPETMLWQIWMMIDGPATFLAASILTAIRSSCRKVHHWSAVQQVFIRFV
jgi:hypothetical protein